MIETVPPDNANGTIGFTIVTETVSMSEHGTYTLVIGPPTNDSGLPSWALSYALLTDSPG
jgi:hypothetical protein